MFNYTVYGVGAVSSIYNYRWTNPVTAAKAVTPVSQSQDSYVGRVTQNITKQAEKSFLHRKQDESFDSSGWQQHARQTTRQSMDALQFFGTGALLMEVRKPVEHEVDFDRYADRLDELCEERGVQLQSRSTASENCPNKSTQESASSGTGVSGAATSDSATSGGAFGQGSAVALT